MSDRKGKARADNDDDDDERQPHANDTSQDSSMLSRVAASAGRLARSAFTSPTSSEINNQAATSLSATGKAPHSSTSGGESVAQAQGSRFHHNSNFSPSLVSGLRSGHYEEYIRQSENEFSQFLDGIDSLQAADNVSGDQTSNETLGAAWSKAANHGTQPNLNMTITEQELRDGQEVVALLADPTGDEDFDRALEEEADFDWGLSPGQLSQLEEITKELFPLQEPHHEVSIDNPLNLVPNLDENSVGQLMGHGIVLPLEQWREQWQGVLTRYTDEVWGNLLPLVEKARDEVSNVGEVTPKPGESSALRRLESILGHLQRR